MKKNSNEAFSIKGYIDDIYNQDKEQAKLFYCDDDGSYDIECSLNWVEETKNSLIENINNLYNDILALDKFDKIACNHIIKKYFKNINSFRDKPLIQLRAHRINKLYTIKTPQIIIDNELSLMISLIIIDTFADKENINIHACFNY